MEVKGNVLKIKFIFCKYTYFLVKSDIQINRIIQTATDTDVWCASSFHTTQTLNIAQVHIISTFLTGMSVVFWLEILMEIH